MWIHEETLVVAKDYADIRRMSTYAYPEDITDSMLQETGWVPVMQTSWGYDRLTERAIGLDPVCIEGTWTQQWDTIKLTDSEIEANRIASIPFSVSPRQIRQALTRVLLREPVEAAIAASDQDTKDWWERSTSFERQHLKVIQMGLALNQSTLQMDDLFILAGSL